LQAPIKGIYEQWKFFFSFCSWVIINIFQESGALVSDSVSVHRMKGKESWLIVIFTFLFSLGGSSYGMQEKRWYFTPVITPIFLAAGLIR